MYCLRGCSPYLINETEEELSAAASEDVPLPSDTDLSQKGLNTLSDR
jgi:hypothetical protein